MSALKKPTRGEVQESLMQQLAQKGAAFSCYEDLIFDYMTLWDTKKKLATDIKKRGVVYEDYSSVGVKMMKNNPSVKEIVMVNRQMMAILKELGLNAGAATGGGGDADDL